MTRRRIGEYVESIREAVLGLQQDRVAERLWAKDASLWTDSDSVAAAISLRLGWLTVIDEMEHHLAELRAFATEVRESGIDRVVLLGMGGSSLGAESIRRSFGQLVGFPALTVLDTVDPAAIADLRDTLDLHHTLFIVSSKSGTTVETIALADYFEAKVRSAGIPNPGRHFIAITDPGTQLARRAKDSGYRRLFLNPTDIGGRYSVLSYSGLVPAALIGVDLLRLLGHASRIAAASGPAVSAEDSPGLLLGAVLGVLGNAGRNKMTFICSQGIAGFGIWAEQLLAESTGKQSAGLVPVLDEPVGEPGVYRQDRTFVFIRLAGDSLDELDRLADALAEAGHPVIQCDLADIYDLGAEFMRWEIATAIAGRLLGINPFDEPNSGEQKAKTHNVLAEFLEDEVFPDENPGAAFGEISIYGATGSSLESVLGRFIEQQTPSSYLAILPYLSEGVGAAEFAEMRRAVRDRFGLATTLGYGPRYLHSTGQLHIGGPNDGLFLIITANSADDIAIPGSEVSFEVLQRAQAVGDFAALNVRGKHVLRINLGSSVAAGLAALRDALSGIAELRTR